MDWIDLGRAALRYDLTGSGPDTLVLIHEMGGTLDSWDQVLPILNRDRLVLRYDTRGAGQSEKLRGAITFDDMADDLAALLDALPIAGPVSLVGCAVGGAIALRFAGRYRARVASLIVMSPATGIAADRRDATLARIAAFEADGPRGAVEASFAASFPPVMRHDMAQFRRFRARWLANDPASYATIYRMLVNSDFTDELKRIACPTLVIAGTHDLARPPAVVAEVARAIPGARLQTIESGHFMAVQTPGLVADAILRFLKE